jgi:pyruvate/2-oxoglutarate dehydrogenase complex dihydrolipoamide acyltransferase (E2) component
MIEVRIPPDLWEDDREGVVVSWLYNDGAVVEAGKLITELMVEKAQLELHAPGAGRLKILAVPETIVRKGDLIAYLEPV